MIAIKDQTFMTNKIPKNSNKIMSKWWSKEIESFIATINFNDFTEAIKNSSSLDLASR